MRVVRDLDGVKEIRELWTSFHAHPNSDIDFFLTILQLRSDILRPYILVVYRDSRPEAILIGRIETTRIDYKFGYKTFYRAPVRQLTFVYGGGLGNLSAENCEACVREVMNSLSRGEAEAVFFNHLRTDSPLYNALERIPGFLARDHFRSSVFHRSMKLPRRAAELNQCIPGDARRESRRRNKRLCADYSDQVEIRCFRTTCDLDRVLQDIEDVARKTYQRGLGVGFIDNSETRQRSSFEAEKGWMRTYVLYVADKPCAFWSGSLYEGTFYSGDVGYDPSFKKYAPGTLILTRILEDLCNEGVREMDFGLGDAEWKQRFGNHHWREASVYLFAPKVKAIFLNLVWSPAILLERAVKRVLQRVQLLTKLKKAWRERGMAHLD
ncbi:MAG: GNAT family N-acetyltransferase [Terriglobales bacterium]